MGLSSFQRARRLRAEKEALETKKEPKKKATSKEQTKETKK